MGSGSGGMVMRFARLVLGADTAIDSRRGRKYWTLVGDDMAAGWWRWRYPAAALADGTFKRWYRSSGSSGSGRGRRTEKARPKSKSKKSELRRVPRRTTDRSHSPESPFVYQQKEERGEFLVSPGLDKELDLCNWGPNPKFAPRISL